MDPYGGLKSGSIGGCTGLDLWTAPEEEMAGIRFQDGQIGITEIPPQNTPRPKTRFFASHYHHKMRDKYANSKRVDAAVAAIRRGEFSDYAKAAAEYECDRSAVSRRVRGLTKSRKAATSFWRQCLTDEQEEVLIQRINDLTDRGMPPTSSIIRNLIEEIRGAGVGKN